MTAVCGLTPRGGDKVVAHPPDSNAIKKRTNGKCRVDMRPRITNQALDCKKNIWKIRRAPSIYPWTPRVRLPVRRILNGIFF
jgi:hypothetical protein